MIFLGWWKDLCTFPTWKKRRVFLIMNLRMQKPHEDLKPSVFDDLLPWMPCIPLVQWNNIPSFVALKKTEMKIYLLTFLRWRVSKKKPTNNPYTRAMEAFSLRKLAVSSKGDSRVLRKHGKKNLSYCKKWNPIFRRCAANGHPTEVLDRKSGKIGSFCCLCLQ